MKKIISVLALSAIVTTTVFSGCNIRVNINENTPTKPTQASEEEVEETTSNTQETVAVENTYETISTTEPPAPDNKALNFLYDFGFTENDLRKEYTFDDTNINCENNIKYVLDRMCNSVDHFTTLQASYTSTVNNKTTWVTYAIDRRVGKAKELVYSIPANKNKCFPSRYLYVDGDYHVKLIANDTIKEKYTFEYDESSDDALKSMTELINKPFAEEFGADIKANSNASAFSGEIFDYINFIEVTRRMGILEDNNNNTMPLMIRRSDNNIGLVTSTEHYLPQDFALDVLLDTSNWKIEAVENNGNNEVICISGTYKDKYYDYERSFKLKIDKNTGILISLQEYNTSGKLVEDFNTEQFILDADIDESIFDTIDPKDIVDTKQQ